MRMGPPPRTGRTDHMFRAEEPQRLNIPKKPPVDKVARYAVVHTMGTIKREVASNGDLSALDLFKWERQGDGENPQLSPQKSPKSRGRVPGGKLPGLPSPRKVDPAGHEKPLSWSPRKATAPKRVNLASLKKVETLVSISERACPADLPDPMPPCAVLLPTDPKIGSLPPDAPNRGRRNKHQGEVIALDPCKVRDKEGELVADELRKNLKLAQEASVKQTSLLSQLNGDDHVRPQRDLSADKGRT